MPIAKGVQRLAIWNMTLPTTWSWKVVNNYCSCFGQVLHWHRKLEMERDMHEALNTTVGTEQISALQRNIQRLSLKHAELLQEQESIIVMMERCVEKRENISMKVRIHLPRGFP